MSYANFKPIIWSKFIQHELEKISKLVDSCNRQFEGEAKKGAKVRILNALSPEIEDYSQEDGLSGPQALGDGTYVDLELDQAKAFNFMVDDIDRMQSIDGLMENIMIEAVRKMNVQRERFVGKLAYDIVAGTADNDFKQFSDSTAISTAKAAKAAVDKGLLALRENDVALDDSVYIEVSPFFYQAFKDDLVDLKTNNDDLINRGIVGMYDGAKVRMSNCLYNDGTDDYCMIRTDKAIAFASGIDKTEAYRPEKFFSDAVKGLNVYGGKIVRPKELYVIKAHK